MKLGRVITEILRPEQSEGMTGSDAVVIAGMRCLNGKKNNRRNFAPCSLSRNRDIYFLKT